METYQLEAVLLGILNAPSTLYQLMDAMLKEKRFAEVYLPIVVMHSTTIDEHKAYFEKVFAVINGHQLMLKVLMW